MIDQNNDGKNDEFLATITFASDADKIKDL